jgi:hypothetical protein
VTTHVYVRRVTMETVARRKADMQLRGSSVLSEKATVTLPKVDFTQSVDRVKALNCLRRIPRRWQTSRRQLCRP